MCMCRTVACAKSHQGLFGMGLVCKTSGGRGCAGLYGFCCVRSDNVDKAVPLTGQRPQGQPRERV